MKFLLTGGSGFIGSHLTDRLLKEGHEVIIVDRSLKKQNLTYHDNLQLHQHDILSDVGNLFKGIDVVFHLAALTRPQWSLSHPYETNEVNVGGTIKVLQHCVDNKVKRIVFMSSSNLYGEQTMYPTAEIAKPNPMNPYALSKLIGEQYCKLFEQMHGLEWNAIRPFNAYGTRMPLTGIYTSAVATFIDVFKNDKPLEMFGDGEQRRDFIHIDDIIDMMMLLAVSKVHGEAFNCGSGTNTSINELLALISKMMKKTIEPKRNPKQFEPSQTLSSTTKAERLLRWRPRVSLEEGLWRTIRG